MSQGAPVTKPVEILQYKTNVGYFVKVSGAYPYSVFSGYIINDISEEEAIKINGYAKLNSEVTSVQKKIPPTKTLKHYTLKDKELESSKFPLIVNHYWDEDFEEYKLQGVEGYEALYEPVWEETKSTLVDVPFVVKNLGEYVVEDPCNIKDRKIKVANDIAFSSKKEEVELSLSQVVTYDDIVKLLTPEFALAQVPCKLTSQQMYRITRQYILEHLDMKENIITSNYDFCFTVKKRVHTKPFVIQESYWQGKKLKSKPVTKNEKQVEVFEMTWAGYKGSGGYEGYTCIPSLEGSSLEDIADKLESYLEGLIKVLNTKVIECECCKGTGHIVEKASCK